MDFKFKEISFPGEKLEYIAPTHDELEYLTFLIAKQILDAGDQIDRIVAMGQGGWVMSRYLYDFLKPMPLKKTVSLGIESYSDEELAVKGNPKIYQGFTTKLSGMMKGERVGIFDDLTDTGGQGMSVRQYLEWRDIDSIFITLFRKPHSQFQPKYSGYETDKWIVFPYEPKESMKLLRHEWQKMGIKEESMKERFHFFGFKEEIINDFLERSIEKLKTATIKP